MTKKNTSPQKSNAKIFKGLVHFPDDLKIDFIVQV